MYWKSKRYYQNIKGKYILRRWWHDLKSIERIQLKNGRWVWSVEGYNVTTKEWYNQCFRNFPNLEEIICLHIE